MALDKAVGDGTQISYGGYQEAFLWCGEGVIVDRN